MRKSQSTIEITKALLAAQGELEAVPLDSENTEVNKYRVHKYSSFTGMWMHVRPILQKNGLVMIQGGGSQPPPAGYLTLETTLLHVSGEYISQSLTIPFKSPDPQAAGSAITYAKRYSLGAILGMVSEHDDDANSASGKTPVRTPAKEKPAEKSLPISSEPAKREPTKKAPPKVDPEKRFNKAKVLILEKLARKKADPTIEAEMDGDIKILLDRAGSYRAAGAMTQDQYNTLADLSKGEFNA
jgi:hypothetical protein